MKKLKLIFLQIFVIVILMNNSIAFAAESKIDFWSNQKKGANIFNRNVTLNDIQAAKKYGIQFIRLYYW